MTAIITLPRWMQPKKKVYVTRSGGPYQPEDVALSFALSLRFYDSADELRALARRLVDKVCLEHQPNMKRLAREPDDALVFDAALKIINRVCDLMGYGPGAQFTRNVEAKPMKALSVRQPWAWLIVHGGKDIENRSWHTKHRGRFLVHAAQGMTKKEWSDAVVFCNEHRLPLPPHWSHLQRGGIIGSVELVDSVDTSESPWYMGEKAFVLRDPEPMDFIPYKGKLNFFEVSL